MTSYESTFMRTTSAFRKPKVLHVLAYSSPTINGYAIRSHDLLVAQKTYGISDPIAITLLNDSFSATNESIQIQQIDGISYYICRNRGDEEKHTHFRKISDGKNSKRAGGNLQCVVERVLRKLFGKSLIFREFLSRRKKMRSYERNIVELAKRHHVDIIHGHTPFYVGLPAMRAARRLGIPFVYEVRGLWEDSAVANGDLKHGSLRYKLFKYHETSLIKRADRVTAIGQQLTLEIQKRRGDNKNKVLCVPNALGSGKAWEVSLTRKISIVRSFTCS